MILCFSFNSNVVPTLLYEYFELVALMGSWAQGISWLKFASVCRLLSFRVKLYLKPRTRHRRDYLAQGTTNFYTKVRFATNILTSTLFDNVLQRSSVQVTLKLLEDYWKMKGHKYNQGLWNVCLVVRCWCWRVSVYNLVRAAVGDTSHAPPLHNPPHCHRLNIWWGEARMGWWHSSLPCGHVKILQHCCLLFA